MNDKFRIHGKIIAEVIKDIDGEYFIRLDPSKVTFLNINQTEKFSKWLSSMNKNHRKLMFR